MKQTVFFFCSLITFFLFGCTNDTPLDPNVPVDTPKGTPTVTLTGTYILGTGEALKTLTITGTTFFVDHSVAGKWSWESPEQTFDATGEYDARWIFTPYQTEQYNQVVGTQKITVKNNQVYVIGNFSPDPGTNKALFWINDVLQPLEKGDNALTSSLFVAGEDTYITGMIFEGGGDPVSVYWKNGKIVPLTDQGNNPYPTSIFVVGNDVYVSGNDQVGNENMAGFWKNGKFTPFNTSKTEANAIYVADGIVYIAGRSVQDDTAILWINGVATPIPAMQNAVSVDKSGVDLYLAGYNTNAVLYTNGKIQELFNSSTYATSMFVSGDDVYICGDEAAQSPQGAWYWHKGIATPLHDGTKAVGANSISVANNKVYVAGCSFTNDESTSVARVWINGVAKSLPSGDVAGCTAIGVVAK